MKYKNLWELNHNDFVKFVIQDYRDFKEAVTVMRKVVRRKHLTALAPRFAFSPCHGKTEPGMLCEWMKQNSDCVKNNAIFNLQLHKIIGVD